MTFDGGVDFSGVSKDYVYGCQLYGWFLRLDLCNAPTGVKGQTLAKEGSTTREVDGELWQAGDHKGSLVRRWTSKLGCCLTRQSKGSCSEAVTEKAISDRPSTDLRTRGSTRNDESR